MSKDIEKLRNELDEISAKMQELFLQRMKVVSDLAEAKKSSGEPTVDLSREEKRRRQILDNPDPIIAKYYIGVDQAILDASYRYQDDIRDNTVSMFKREKIAYFGLGHSNTYVSLVNYLRTKGYRNVSEYVMCDGKRVIELIGTSSWEELGRKIDEKEADCAFLPFTNSSSRAVLPAHALMEEGHYELLDTFKDKIRLFLYVPANSAVTKLEEVQTIFSNQPALNQCSDFIHANMMFATFRSSVSTTKSIEDMLAYPGVGAAAFANADTKDDPRVRLLHPTSVSNENGVTVTEYLLVKKREERVLEAPKDDKELFYGYYLYTSARANLATHSVEPAVWRVVKIECLDGRPFMQGFTFDIQPKMLFKARNVLIAEGDIPGEEALVYEYISKNDGVGGLAKLQCSKQMLLNTASLINGYYLGKTKGKAGTLAYYRIEKEEYDIYARGLEDTDEF